MMRTFLTLITFCLTLTASAELTIADGGLAKAVIVIDTKPDRTEQTVSKELQAYLQEISGARLRVARRPTAGVNILLGRCQKVLDLMPDFDWDSLGYDGVVVRTIDNNVIIAGGEPRGLSNALHVFLSVALGCRWWSADAATIPQQTTITIPELDVVHVPGFAFRFDSGEASRKGQFRRQTMHSGVMSKFDPDGESILLHLVPKSEFLEHPEWFMHWETDTPLGDVNEEYTIAYGLELLRQGSEAQHQLAVQERRLPYQPCMTSDAALQAAKQNALLRLEEHYPVMQKHPPAILWVVQQDGRYFCRCSDCVAGREAEGSESGNWLAFTNAVAEAITEQYPDVLVGMHAYLHTIKPPKTVRPHDNVLIYIASLDRDQKKDFSQHADGTYIKGWCDIAKNVWVWDYDTNFRNYITPHPNYLTTARNIRFCAEAGCTGMRIQGSHGRLSDLYQMRDWVNLQLMWDPSRAPDALRREFCDGFYGPAGKHVIEYVTTLDEIINRDDTFLSCFSPTTENWLSLEDLNAITRIVENAESAAANDPVLSKRVKQLRFSVNAVWLRRYQALKTAAADSGLPFLGPEDPQAALAEFEALLDQNIGHYRQNVEIPELMQILREAIE